VPPVSTTFRRTGLLLCSLAVVALMSVVLPARASSGASTAADATWGTAPAADGRSQLVWAMQPAGGKVYVGGEFTQLVPPAGDNGPAVTRNHLAAFDIDSHALLPWDPDANGNVRALALSADGTKLYVGGDFTKIGGVSASKIAVLDLATGKVVKTFKSQVKGRVFSIALSGNRLFVGGDFTEVGVAGGGTVTRNTVAALDATTGAVLDWTPPPLGPGRYLGHTGTPTPDAPSGYTYAVAVPADGSRVYVGGNFLDLGGQGGMVVLDGSTGAALAQQWTVDRPVFDLSVWPGDGTTVFAATGGPGGRIFAFRPSVPSRPLWKASVDGDAVGVAASNTTVFLVGHYDYIVNKKSDCYQYCPDGTPRKHLTAFDAATGAVDPWNPAADTPTGPYSVAVGDDHVFVGGEFTKINGAPQPGFAQFALPPSLPPATSSTTATTSHSSTSSTTATTSHSSTSTTATTSPSSSTSSTTATTAPSSTSSTTATTVKPQPPTTTTLPPTTTTTRPRGLLGGLFG
jgi:hypothetical protein